MLGAEFSDKARVRIEVWSACEDYHPLSTHSMLDIVLPHHKQSFCRYYYYPQITQEWPEAQKG